MSSATPSARSSAPSSDHDNFVGRALDGRYYLTQRLGAGGMSSVYEGEHITLGTRFAIKVLQSGLAAYDKNRRRFLQEARAAASIRSPYIVQIYDYGVTSDGIVYFVMELLIGRDLARVLKDDGPLPWSRAQPMLVQIAHGLQTAHDHGVIHRDVKPSNCFLVEDNVVRDAPQVKLLDFGIAKFSDRRLDLEALPTSTREIIGTPGYIAPERLEGIAANAISDVYSLGALMYRMMVGQLPYRGHTAFQVFEQQVRHDPPRPSDVNPSIHPAVETTILRALARRPQDRYTSIAALLQDLERLDPRARRGTPVLVRSEPDENLDEANASAGPLAPSVSRPPAAKPIVQVPTPVPHAKSRMSWSRVGWVGGLCLCVVAGIAILPRVAKTTDTVAPAERDGDGMRTNEGIAEAAEDPTSSHRALVDDSNFGDRTSATLPGTSNGPVDDSNRGPSSTFNDSGMAPRDDATSSHATTRRVENAPRRPARHATETAPARTEGTTEGEILRRIERLVRERCSPAHPLSVRGAVGSDGRFLSVQVQGDDAKAQDCARPIVKAQSFPAGTVRMMTFEIHS